LVAFDQPALLMSVTKHAAIVVKLFHQSPRVALGANHDPAGFIKSRTAQPSRRNSGLLTTRTRAVTVVA
jgi:hypothetical protein